MPVWHMQGQEGPGSKGLSGVGSCPSPAVPVSAPPRLSAAGRSPPRFLKKSVFWQFRSNQSGNCGFGALGVAFQARAADSAQAATTCRFVQALSAAREDDFWQSRWPGGWSQQGEDRCSLGISLLSRGDAAMEEPELSQHRSCAGEYRLGCETQSERPGRFWSLKS